MSEGVSAKVALCLSAIPANTRTHGHTPSGYSGGGTCLPYARLLCSSMEGRERTKVVRSHSAPHDDTCSPPPAQSDTHAHRHNGARHHRVGCAEDTKQGQGRSERRRKRREAVGRGARRAHEIGRARTRRNTNTHACTTTRGDNRVEHAVGIASRQQTQRIKQNGTHKHTQTHTQEDKHTGSRRRTNRARRGPAQQLDSATYKGAAGTGMGDEEERGSTVTMKI